MHALQFNFSPVSLHVKPNFSAGIAVKRHQSFHGFQNTPNFNFGPTPNFSQSFISYWPQQGAGFVPCLSQQNQFFVRNPFAPTTTRVVGRRERAPKETTTVKKPCSSNEKRFGSLEMKKHRCYSPTFYSLRCKKHAKKRPVIYAIPKKLKGRGDFENLTDSVQIFEQNKTPPKPAPRTKKPNSIYQNANATLDNSSNESCTHEVSTTEVVVHGSPLAKDSPTVMVKPSFVKPKVESPKGALSLQIQAKLKRNDSPPTPTDELGKEVPEMPILDKWDTNKLKSPNQVCLIFF